MPKNSGRQIGDSQGGNNVPTSNLVSSQPASYAERRRRKQTANKGAPPVDNATPIRGLYEQDIDEHGSNTRNFILAPRSTTVVANPSSSQVISQGASAATNAAPGTLNIASNFFDSEVMLDEILKDLNNLEGFVTPQSQQQRELLHGDDGVSQREQARDKPLPPTNNTVVGVTDAHKDRVKVMDFALESSQLADRVKKLQVTINKYDQATSMNSFIDAAPKVPTLDLRVNADDCSSVLSAQIVSLGLQHIQAGMRENPINVPGLTKMIEMNLKVWIAAYKDSPPPDLASIVQALKSVVNRINGRYVPPTSEEHHIKKAEEEIQKKLPLTEAAYEETFQELNAIEEKESSIRSEAAIVKTEYLKRKERFEELEREYKRARQSKESYKPIANAARKAETEADSLAQSKENLKGGVSMLGHRAAGFRAQKTEVEKSKQKVDTPVGSEGLFVLNLPSNF